MDKYHEEEIEKIYQTLLNAVPMGACFGDIIVALNELSMEFAIMMGEQDNDDEQDEEELNSYKNGKDSHLN